MTGHNWGSEHAARWVWLHATAFADEPGAWLDLALGRVRVGESLTPWIVNGALALDGRRHRVGHEVLNCSIAEMRVRLERPGRPPLELATAHGCAYELGLPPGTGHGVPLEPFPDP